MNAGGHGNSVIGGGNVGEARFRHVAGSRRSSVDEIRPLPRISGWSPSMMWTDGDAAFSLSLWWSAAPRLEP
jgi:hypothetical protein